MTKSNDKLGHRGRLRERFLQNGLDAFQNHEVLELFLTYAIPRRDVKPLAKQLLTKFGSLSNILEASEAELLDCNGIGDNVTMLLALFKAVGNSLLKRSSENVYMRKMITQDEVVNFARTRISPYSKRKIMLVTTDARDRLIFWDFFTQVQFYGEFFPKRLCEVALEYQVKHLWLICYNEEILDFLCDKEVILVNEIFQQLNGLGVIFEDYLVIAKNRVFSTQNSKNLNP